MGFPVQCPTRTVRQRILRPRWRMLPGWLVGFALRLRQRRAWLWQQALLHCGANATSTALAPHVQLFRSTREEQRQGLATAKVVLRIGQVASNLLALLCERISWECQRVLRSWFRKCMCFAAGLPMRPAATTASCAPPFTTGVHHRTAATSTVQFRPVLCASAVCACRLDWGRIAATRRLCPAGYERVSCSEGQQHLWEHSGAQHGSQAVG